MIRALNDAEPSDIALARKTNRAAAEPTRGQNRRRKR